MVALDRGVQELLGRLVRGQQRILKGNLVGSYLFGSAVTGDFDRDVSDVDTVAVLRSALSEIELSELKGLHEAIAAEMPRWSDRVEVVYVTSAGLEAFRTTPSPAARISPGEPFHRIVVDHRWLIDWYQARDADVALCGPPVASVVPFISHEGFVEGVRQHVLAWRAWELETPRQRAYAILTACRGLRTVRTGEHVSKREAARWACEAFPQHADLISAALSHRQGDGRRMPADATATRRFLVEAAGLIA